MVQKPNHGMLGNQILMAREKISAGSVEIQLLLLDLCLEGAELEKKPVKSDNLPRGTGCILVVDDEAIMREVAGAILDELGYSTILAENGEEAVNIYRERRNDISMVLLDVIMPQRSGRQVYNDLKEIDPDVRVLFASGYWQDDEDEWPSFDDVHFIQKPYTLQEIAQAIQKRLS